uniref:Uncharacterized protein n=1 Tax=Prolemur simus TaxID=1328070 RepID=A0A8C8ZNG9_PROSS
MAEDHGLSNRDGPIEVAQGLELLVSAIAQNIILLDGVQGLLLTLQFDNVWVRDHFLGKLPHRHPASSSLPLDADALILVALSSYHHVGLIQNKHLDLLGVDELELGAPVQHGPRGADDNLLTDFLTPFHSLILTFIASHGISQLQLWMKFAHLLDHFSCLKCQLISWGEAQTLTEKSQRMICHPGCSAVT